ncbi:MAG: ABC transporter permease [Lactobacillus sp.]|jgi:putative ABC transport system permease protein|nr:ABC transporter permease [Lactobacillus sp.]
MFLALKEIKHEKLRYGLIIGMVLLISYLVYILSGLAFGLAQQNTQGVESWGAERIVLDKDANTSLQQSLLTKSQTDKLTLSKNESYVGQSSVVAKGAKARNISAQFIGLDTKQYIAQDMKLTSGHQVNGANQVVVDSQFQQDGYKLGDTLKFNSKTQAYTIVGFTENAKLNIAPIIYGNLSTWRTLKNLPDSFTASGIVSKNAKYTSGIAQLKSYDVHTFIQALPGYSAQNTTFTLMIGFLMVISIVVIAVFLYILTIQKLPNYAVLRAQGVPAKTLVQNTISQALLLVSGGLVLAIALTALTASVLPMGVPIGFNLPLLAVITVGIILTGILGAIIPVRLILKVDPVSVIG